MIQEETALSLRIVSPNGEQHSVAPDDIRKRDDANDYSCYQEQEYGKIICEHSTGKRYQKRPNLEAQILVLPV